MGRADSAPLHNFGTINDYVMKPPTDVLHQQRNKLTSSFFDDVIIFSMTSSCLLNYDPIPCVIQNRFTAAVLLIVGCNFVFGKVKYPLITYQTVFQ